MIEATQKSIAFYRIDHIATRFISNSTFNFDTVFISSSTTVTVNEIIVRIVSNVFVRL